jgi:hypothetical protein
MVQELRELISSKMYRAAMQLVSTFVGPAMILLATSLAFAGEASHASGAIEIQVEAGNWGNAHPRDIEAVLTTVADTLLPSFPQHAAERISVAYSAAGPSVLLEKSSAGAHRVFLNVQDARWDQFTYQFSHELCHIFTNHEHREIAPGVVARDHQWFEETLCEAVSLVALERMASHWERSPPHPAWKAYASAFREYAQQLRNEPHRRLSPDETVEQWFAANREALERNPYLRQKNELLAVKLLALLETTPEGLEAIGYLNAEPSAPTGSLATYLESWYSCCPQRHRAFVIQVIALLDGSAHTPM